MTFFLTLEKIEIVRKEFEKYFAGYDLIQKDIDYFNRIYILNDSLIILSEIIEDKSSRPLNIRADKTKYFLFQVEELTYNEIGFKFNNSKFIRNLKLKLEATAYIELDIKYKKFVCPEVETVAEQFDKIYPELNLRERYKNWQGVKYYFIVFDFEDILGKIHHAVAFTTQLPHNYMINFGKEFIRRGRFNEGGFVRYDFVEFKNFFASWKGVKRQKILEEHLKYSVVEKYSKIIGVENYYYADNILKKANAGEYDNFDKATYLRPIKKWISEELVFNITKKIFKNHKVIHQHRPFFLKSPKGGQMSYDVFISKLNIAIEYQGKQHFEPVEYFGGEKAFEELKIRDNEKLRLSNEHGVRLVYINYWEEITENLIREKVENLR